MIPEKVRKNNILFGCYLLSEKVSGIIPDELFLKLKYAWVFRRRLDTQAPLTYNEKIQWIKLNYRPPLLTKLSDKLGVRSYVSDRIGAEHLVPLLGAWDSFDKIAFEDLPEKFILKCTHDSGSATAFTGDPDTDIKKIRKHINMRMRRNYYLHSRQWSYKHVRPMIIAEPVLSCADGRPFVEYKAFCFGGRAEWIAVCKGKAGTKERTNDIYNRGHGFIDMRMSRPNSEGDHDQRPECWDSVIELSEKLSEGIPHARVDFYDIDGRLYFSEITLYPDGGFVRFDPPEWDRIFGEKLILPEPAVEKRTERK